MNITLERAFSIYIVLPVPEFCLIKTDSVFSIPVLASLVLCMKTTNRRLNRSEFKKLKIEDCYLYWHFMVATSAYLFVNAKCTVHTHHAHTIASINSVIIICFTWKATLVTLSTWLKCIHILVLEIFWSVVVVFGICKMCLGVIFL